MCKINKQGELIVVEITKDTAEFIRKHLPEANIYKTMRGHTSRRGCYYAEETQSVLKLIDKYNKTINVIEKYPDCK